MCGIVGFVGSARPDVLVAVTDSLIHRGPDGEGRHIEQGVGLHLGQRRLAILDIAGGAQPMWDAERRCVVIFNGQIYNHAELRRELEALGRPFHSDHSDTEVILQAYLAWGIEGMHRRFNGMWAFVLYDLQRKRLLLSRDRFGEKPLYYTDQPAGFAFASELKALIVLPDHAFTVDPRAAHDVFSFGHVRTPRSIYAEVRTLPPGHVLTVGETGAPQLHAYWTPRYAAPETLSEAAWIERFRDTWLDVVKSQMLADVDVGAFLSGGVDSSAVVAAMQRLADRPVKTFTIGFPEKRYDESPLAESVARHLGTDHRTLIVGIEDARDVLPKIQRCYDEPFADSSAIPTWYLSRMAAEHVKVALSGDGGDEIFFGYKRHLTERQVGRLPAPIRHAARAFGALPPMPWRAGAEIYQRWQKTARSAGLPDGMARFFAKTQITAKTAAPMTT